MPRKKNRVNKAYDQLARQCFLEELNIPDEFIEWQFYFYSKISCLKEFQRWYKFKRVNRQHEMVINTEKNEPVKVNSPATTKPKYEYKEEIEEDDWEGQYWQYMGGQERTYKQSFPLPNRAEKQMVMPAPAGLSGGIFVCH